MNTRQVFGEWLNSSPEKYGRNNNDNSDTNIDYNSQLLPIVEYFSMAIEDGVFSELGVVWQNDAIVYRGKKYYDTTFSTPRDNIQKIEFLFQSLMGFSPRVFCDWGDQSSIPKEKFAQAILGGTR